MGRGIIGARDREPTERSLKVSSMHAESVDI